MSVFTFGHAVLLAGLAAQSVNSPVGPPPQPAAAPEIRADKPGGSEKPFERLFQAQLRELQQKADKPQLEWKGDAVPTPEARVECGMVVVHVNPRIDPRMVFPVPGDRDYKLRRIEAPDCKK
jgi:hypothetical protein